VQIITLMSGQGTSTRDNKGSQGVKTRGIKGSQHTRPPIECYTIVLYTKESITWIPMRANILAV
jgi:hypothetical protein